jgi:hypothetical protein
MIRSYLPKTPQRSSIKPVIGSQCGRNYELQMRPGILNMRLQPRLCLSLGHQTALPTLSETYHDPPFI